MQNGFARLDVAQNHAGWRPSSREELSDELDHIQLHRHAIQNEPNGGSDSMFEGARSMTEKDEDRGFRV